MDSPRTKDGAPDTFVTLTPNDGTLLKGFQWIKVGVAGNLALKGVQSGAPACTPFPVAAGEYVPFGSGYLMSTGTTATGFTGIG